MHTTKYNNMMAAYDGFKGHVTVAAVRAQIPDELTDRLTGHELGLVMSAINSAYHNGRASTGAEVYDANPVDGAVWINAINRSVEWRQIDGDLQCIALPEHQ